MPVTPPYSIIDTIARLRAQGGEAWGNAFQNVGQSVGGGLQQMGQNARAKTAAATLRTQQLTDQDRKDVADRYHDVMTAWDRDHSGHMVTGGAQPGAGPVPATPGAPSGILQAAPAGSGNMSTVPPLVGQTSQPPAALPAGGTPPQPGPSTEGLNNMAEFFKAHGVIPPKGSEKIWAKPNIDTKSEAAETVASTKAAGVKDAAKIGKTMIVDDKMAKRLGIEPGELPTSAFNKIMDSHTKELDTKIKAGSAEAIAEKRDLLLGKLQGLKSGTAEYDTAYKAWADFDKANPLKSAAGMGPKKPTKGGADYSSKSDEDLLSGK